LIETGSPATAELIESTESFGRLMDAIRARAGDVRVTVARNARRIGDVDTTRQGLFLFNHFAADDPKVMLQLWDYLAGWYEKETGLDNSVALTPVDEQDSDYAVINWARWDENPLKHFWHQLSKRSFWDYVTTNLDANCAASMPIYCRLA
jgi:hypothetical protein